jgi:hypothetical protein
VTATNGPAAGLVGFGGTDISVAESFAASNVKAASNGDPLIGGSSSNLVRDCFYDPSKSCSNCSTMLGTAITGAGYLYQAQNAPMTHWDFDNVWVQRNNDYPDLR